MEKAILFIMVLGVGVVSSILLLSKINQPNTPNLDMSLSPTAAQTSPSATQTSPTAQIANLLYPQSEWVTNATQAAIITAKGTIVIQLYSQDAPKTVTNFATLARKGYYDNLTFHRVDPGFVIQGGDPNGNGTGGRSIYGDTFADELNPNTPSYQAGYKEGVVAMANRGPNTNGSQFFIMLADNNQLAKNYTIFGKVTSGMDVVQKIAVGDKMDSITIQ